MKKYLKTLKSFLPLLALLAAYIWSMVSISMSRVHEEGGDEIVLRLGHWQLEASVREALDKMAADYSLYRRERGLKPVRIIQDAIPEMIYSQWLTTQLMGRTAPDLIEVGLGALPYHLWLQYYNRYFIPLTPYVNKPNHYNDGTDLDGVPLRTTFKDGMRSSFVEEMQEYICIPLSQFGERVFYNKDLLKKLTGCDQAPKDYREFLAVCKKIKSQKAPNGQPYIPIAGSKYHLPMWEGPMFDPLTYSVKDIADFNRDGIVDSGEQYVAVKTGRLTFQHPAIRARYRMLREVTDNFQVGYTGLTRDEAVFLFAQQRAVFMTTGTWDARSLLEQAEGTFRVGVMDYPMPRRDDPVYGPVMRGPNYERIDGGFRFAITRNSKHPDVALDFLLYMAGQAKNGELNEIIGWIPSTRGAPTPSFLEGFEPHLRGVYGCFRPDNLGGETWLMWIRLYTGFQVGKCSYDEMAKIFEPFYKKRGMVDFLEQQKGWRRSMLKDAQFLAGVRAAAIYDTNKSESWWIRYRSLTADRMITKDVEHERQMRMVTKGLPDSVGNPYEYSPQVLKRVEKHLKSKQKKSIPR